jgi:uncharacterized membrane protein YkvA (DUF1232 family)
MFVFLSYGGGDATNGASFIDFHNNGFDVYSSPSPWPYFPFANSFLWLWGEISEIFNISVNQSYRLFNSFFDSLISLLIFYFFAVVEEKKKALIAAILYALNPISIIVFSMFGFTDSFSLLFLLMAVVIYERIYDNKKHLIIAILLAISISAKPIALIFIPFFLIHSDSKQQFISVFIIVSLLLNSYYLFGAKLEDVANLLPLIFGKILYGHQLGPLGLGALTQGINISYFLLKIISLIGLFSLLLVYTMKFDSRPSEFILIVFVTILLFRKSFHPQYLTWIVPFLFISISNRKRVFQYICVGTFALLAIGNDWTGSMGAFSLPASFQFTLVSQYSPLSGLYEYLSNPLYMGVVIMISLLFIFDKSFYYGMYKSLCGIYQPVKKTLSLEKISIFDLIKALTIVAALIFIYLLLIFGSVTNHDFSVYVRIFTFIGIPALLLLYTSMSCKNINKVSAYWLTIIYFFITTCVTYVLYNYGGDYWIINDRFINASIIYLVLVILSLPAFFKKRLDFPSNGYNNEAIVNRQGTIYIKSISALIIALSILLTLFSWNDLYKSAGVKFNRDVIANDTLDNNIKIESPVNAFDYGVNYVYKAQLNVNKYATLKDIKNIYIKLLTDSYYLVQLNGIEIKRDYGSFYFMHHSSKKKEFIHEKYKTINISNNILDGNNDLLIINNISVPDKTIGLSASLVVDLKDNSTIEVDLSDLIWDVYTATYQDESVNIKDKLSIERLTIDSYENSKYYPLLKEFSGKKNIFMNVKYLNKYRSLFSSIDLFLFLFVFILMISFVIIPSKINNPQK